MAAANWMIKQGGDRIGGLPPHLMDATVGLSDSEASVHSQLIDDFRSKFFLNSQMELEKQNIFLAAFLCRWEAFKDSTEFVSNGVGNNIITQNVARVIRTVIGLDYTMFLGWCQRISMQFKLKNISALPIQHLRDIPQDALIDGRTYNETLNRLLESNALMSEQMLSMQSTQVSMIQLFTTYIQKREMAESPNELAVVKATDSDGYLENDLTINPSFALWFENKAIRRSNDVLELFVHWYKYKLEEGRNLDNRCKPKRKKPTYSKYHNCVKEMKLILSVPVDPYPATIGLESIRWEKLYTDKLKTKFKVLGLCGKNSNMATLTTLNAHRKNRIKLSTTTDTTTDKGLSPNTKRLKLSQTKKSIQSELV